MARPSKASIQEAGIEVREKIIRAAIDLVGERGFASIGVREIAARAGCTISMISYHFNSKNGLLEALVNTHMSNLRGRMSHVVNEASNPNELVSGIVDMLFETVCSNDVFFRTALRDIILVKDHPLHGLLLGIEQANVALATELLTKACKRHGKRLSTPPRLLLMQIISSILLWKLGGPLSAALVGPDTPEARLELKSALRCTLMNAIVDEHTDSQGGDS